MNDAEALEKTLERLRTTGWTKRMVGPPQGPNCITGAMAEVMSNFHLRVPIFKLLTATAQELFPDRTHSAEWDLITMFNDDPETTFEDVEQVLEKVIVKLHELV